MTTSADPNDRESVTLNEDAAIRKYPILKLFSYEHLPQPLQARSKPFQELAMKVAREGPHNAETSVGLRKLREAKDCVVGALITG